MPNNIKPTNEPLDDKSPAATTAFKTLVYDKHWDFADPLAGDATAGNVADSIPASTGLNYAGDPTRSAVNGDKPALSWSSIWKFITPAPNPDSPWNDSGPEANPNGVLDEHEPLADRTPAATTALKTLAYDRHADFADPVVVDATAQAVKQFTWAMFLCFVGQVDTTAHQTPTTWACPWDDPNGRIDEDDPLYKFLCFVRQMDAAAQQTPTPWDDSNPNGGIDEDEPLHKFLCFVRRMDVAAPQTPSPWDDSHPNNGIGKDEPLDDKTPTAKTDFKVLIYDIDWNSVSDVSNRIARYNFASENPNSRILEDEPLEDGIPPRPTSFAVLLSDSNQAVSGLVTVDVAARILIPSIPNPNGRIDKNAPLDNKTSATKPAFKVLVYDNNGDFVDKVAVDAIAQTITLDVNPVMASNVYWMQDSTGAWINLRNQLSCCEMVTESERQWLDLQIANDWPLDVDDVITTPGAAGHIPLSLVGQAPDLASDGLWF
ncbi:hypothetical protein D5038_11810 [Verminephrobacter aporrectodeae subsp. tuberculatae]|uniref:hypothetical protein n=1 Tax=Verminephrobacter aporrectodeae TaxID=1110389 RepID=UPI002238F2B8|nr:hypothetical protein [Verminephrobacter aporrectodeae]MCW5257014.1 hypothetical protein [Verminephrobacter aporrectodeae subsp. tuberculatae]